MFRDVQHGGRLPARSQEQLLTIPLDRPVGGLDGALVVPEHARGIALFVHGSIPCHGCPCDSAVARGLERSGFATLLVDLLTTHEADEDVQTGRYAVDLDLFVSRVIAVTRWLASSPGIRSLPLGYFGAGTGAAAALAAAVALPGRVAAVVSCGGRVDLLDRDTLARVEAPVLLVEGTAEGGPRACEKDERVLAVSRLARESLSCARLAVVPGATHWLRDPAVFSIVAHLAAEWFQQHLVAGARPVSRVR